MKNIFRERNNQNQSLDELTANKITVQNDLCLSGFNVGSLLTNTNDGDDCLNELTVGNGNNLLSVDPAISQPRWTNNITVDEVNTNALKFTSGTTQEGDLLTIDTDNSTVDRIPLGPSGTVLTSNGTQPEWQAIILPDPLVLNDLQVTNSTNLAPNITITTNNGQMNVVGNIVRFLPSYIYEELPITNSLTGAIIGPTNLPWPTQIGVRYELSVTFQCVSVASGGNDVTNRMVIRLRDGATSLDEAVLTTAHSGFPAYTLRAFTINPNINPSLFIFQEPGADPSTSIQLRNIRFSYRPLV